MKPIVTKDKMVMDIMRRMSKRSNQGLKTYGVTMSDATKPDHDWITDAQEEAWDLIVYLEKIRTILPK